MTTLWFVAVGGAFGALSRYGLGRWVTAKFRTGFPYGTFIINLTGAFLLGALYALDLSPWFAALLGDGFLGAFTTFSTFMYEGFGLLKNRHRLSAALYIGWSFVLGVCGFGLGYFLMNGLN